jgi:putative thiamine transport system ATP-binding protein
VPVAAKAASSVPPSQASTARLAGTDLLALPPHRRRLGILFQDDLLFPHLTLAENLAFGLPRGIPRRPAIEAALRDAELEGMGGRRPATLSGGQRARAALFRTLLSGPRALLLDEPFGALDVALRARMRDLVLRQAEARGLPVLLVTHDPADAMGHVVRLGAPPSGGREPVA